MRVQIRRAICLSQRRPIRRAIVDMSCAAASCAKMPSSEDISITARRYFNGVVSFALTAIKDEDAGGDALH
jgi:hypothetical protein